MKKVISLFLVGVMAALMLLSGCQQKASNTKMVVGLDPEFPPMGFKEDGEIVGFDIDCANEVAKRLDMEIEFVPIKWDNKVAEIDNGNINIIWNGFTISDEMKEAVNFTDPYMRNNQVIVIPGGAGYATLADLSGKVLGVQKGSSAVNALEKAEDFHNSLSDVIKYESNTLALTDMDISGCDAVLMDEIVARYIIRTQDKDYQILDESLAEEEYGIGFKKGDNELRDKVWAQMEAMADDGTLAEISERWFGADITVVK